MAAGAATKKDTIGYVAPFAIPEVIRHANAFALGAQSVNPKAKVKVIWTKAGSTRPRSARPLRPHRAGADVIGQNVDSPAAGSVAERRVSRGSGTTLTRARAHPTSWLTAAVYNWGPYYPSGSRRRSTAPGRPATTTATSRTGSPDIAPFGTRSRRPPGQRSSPSAPAIVKGPLNSIFTGPIRDQGGKIRMPPGKRRRLGDILAMNWFVKGIVGNPKG